MPAFWISSMHGGGSGGGGDRSASSSRRCCANPGRLLISVAIIVGYLLSAAQGEEKIWQRQQPRCRLLPTDPGWPSNDAWAALNATVGGRLVRGVPLASPCYGASPDAEVCARIQRDWALLPPFIEDPVNVIATIQTGDSCVPFAGPLALDPAARAATCTLGGLAPYAINATDAAALVAGVDFARGHNLRLTVKNTGHDFLGRSAGNGSLALWTHHMKDVTFIPHYSEDGPKGKNATGTAGGDGHRYYSGPAMRIGAGVTVQELYEAASRYGHRATSGVCPSVGAAGGWIQGGGHGPLTARYGLGADQTLEFEVVTADGRHANASRRENEDLFWALSGGGAGNFAVVVSVTVQAHPDGPVSGARLTFVEPDPARYWAAVEEWHRHLLRLDADYPALGTQVLLAAGGYFDLNYATLPDDDADATAMRAALQPFHAALRDLGIVPIANETAVDAGFLEHFNRYSEGTVYTRNVTLGNRIVPRSLVRRPDGPARLAAHYREMLSSSAPGAAFVYIIAANVSLARVGHISGDGSNGHSRDNGKNSSIGNAVLPAWRDGLYIANFGRLHDPRFTVAQSLAELDIVNGWQLALRAETPAGEAGAYMNEATYNFPFWMEDYYGANYGRLVTIKERWDPDRVLWSETSAGGDAWKLRSDGHLCKAESRNMRHEEDV